MNTTSADHVSAVETNQRVIPLEEMIERVKNEPPVEYVYRGISIPCVAIVYGVPKGGKTTYTECFLLSIACGREEFLGHPIKIENRKVVFVSFEEQYKTRTARNVKQTEYLKLKGYEPGGNYFVVTEHIPRSINNDEDWKILKEIISKYSPGVVVIDSLSRLTDGEISDEKTAKKIMHHLREISIECNVAILVINHTPKRYTDSALEVHSMSGSRIFAQEVDLVIGVNKTARGIRYVKYVVSRNDKDDDDEVTTYKITDHRWIEVIGTATESSILAGGDGRIDNKYRDIILEYFNDKEGDVPTSQLYEDLVDTDVMAKKTLHSGLNKLVDEGKLEKPHKGFYKKIIPES